MPSLPTVLAPVVLCLVAVPLARAGAQSAAAVDESLQRESFEPRPAVNPFRFPHMPETAFGLHLGGGSVQFDPRVAQREGMGDAGGFVFGCHAVLWRFFFADVGMGWLWAPDTRPFLETACGVFTGDCRTDESGIDGFMAWAKVGPQARFFVPLGDDALEIAILAGLGLRDWNLSREAKHGGTCSDCLTEEVDADGGALLSPEIDLAYAFGTQVDSGAVGVKALYEHYLAGEAIRGLWFSLFFEGYLW